jgi:hypothetical protein
MMDRKQKRDVGMEGWKARKALNPLQTYHSWRTL